MRMFESILSTIPKNRLDMVNYLDLPDVTLAPYTWRDLDDSLTRLGSLSPSVSLDDYDVRTASSESLALSRAMTDSEIDYERYRRLRRRSFSDPWDRMRACLDSFPAGYIDSLRRYPYRYLHYSYPYRYYRYYVPPVESSVPATISATERILRENRLLRLRMRAYFDKDCCVFKPDDPGLLDLEDALASIDMKKLERELDHLPMYSTY